MKKAEKDLRRRLSEFRRTKQSPTPAELGKLFGQIQVRGAGLLWLWSQVALAVFKEGQGQRPRLTMRRLGERVGLAARGRVLSTAWVSRALAAARAWPKSPQKQADRVRFSLEFHGNIPRIEQPDDEPEIAVRRVMKRLRLAVAEAIELGCRRDAVLRFIDAALVGVQEVNDDDDAMKMLTQGAHLRSPHEHNDGTVTMSSTQGDTDSGAHEPGGRAPARQVHYCRPRVLAG